MDTEEVAQLLSMDAYTKDIVCEVFDGVHAADQLHLPKERPLAMVINTDPSWKGGRHWVTIYVPDGGPWEYFDSYGELPNQPFIRQFLEHRQVIHNRKVLQSPSSDVCGHYCIYYLIHRARGYSMDAIVKRFSNDTDRNDKDVKDFIIDEFVL